ncbi:MAG TPA: ABC transporter permease subunit [Gaiellales bacterium]|jgi:ABC-type transport system involved in multi-copper enzyme maturation permease subunit
MIAQSRAELLKIRSTRTTLGLGLGMVAIILLFVILAGLLSDLNGLAGAENERQFFGTGSGSGLFAALAGIMLVTGEYRFGTIRPTLLFTPRRSTVLNAKVIASVLAGIALAVTGEVLAVAVGEVILHSRGVAVDLDRHDWTLLTIGTVGGTALWGAIGVGLGMIVRNQVGAIIGLLAWLFLVENLLFGLAPSVGRYVPSQAQNALMGFTTDHLLSPAAGAAVLVVWTVVLCVVGAALAARRDVS